VAAVNGRSQVANPFATILSYYQYIENVTYQNGTVMGNYLWHLSPPLLGSNFAIRRDILAALGFFSPDLLLEDSDISLKLAQASQRVVIAPLAISRYEVPTGLAAYLTQHSGWARGFFQIFAEHWRAILASRHRSVWRRLEELFFALGYFDRVLYLLAAGLSLLPVIVPPCRSFPVEMWLFFLAAPLFELLAALWFDRAPWRSYAQLPLLGLLFPLDIFMAVRSFLANLCGYPLRGYKTEREPDRRLP
jgi:cellulose synthase/poly-beta-1,6-N-acetylglucosamine synthase-like glycosyltransferase